MKDKLLITTLAVLFGFVLTAQPALSRTLHSFHGAAIGNPGAANKGNAIPAYKGKASHGGRSEMAIPGSHLKLINRSHLELDPTG